MTLGDFRAATAHLPDNTPLWFADINFGGMFEPLEPSDIELDHNNILLIRAPYQEAYDG